LHSAATAGIRITPEFSQVRLRVDGLAVHRRPRYPQIADIAVVDVAVDGQAQIVISWVRRMPSAVTATLVVAAVATLIIGDAIAAAGAVSPPTSLPRSALGVPPGRAPAVVSTIFVWPLAGPPVVIGEFDPPAEPWLPGHRGVDLAALLDESVYAAGAGTVSFAGRVAGIGVVSITHADGLRTTYEPVAATVHAGDRVAIGTPIGRIDARLPHCAPGSVACLHWGLLRAGVYLDPLTLLGLGEVRLYPSP
jgi:murein DD-endopeptidase MepM/ murein hydrolase activator NlpD